MTVPTVKPINSQKGLRHSKCKGVGHLPKRSRSVGQSGNGEFVGLIRHICCYDHGCEQNIAIY